MGSTHRSKRVVLHITRPPSRRRGGIFCNSRFELLCIFLPLCEFVFLTCFSRQWLKSEDIQRISLFFHNKALEKEVGERIRSTSQGDTSRRESARHPHVPSKLYVLCVCSHYAAPEVCRFLSTVQVHHTTGLQVLCHLRVPHILLHIHSAGPRLAQVSLRSVQLTLHPPCSVSKLQLWRQADAKQPFDASCLVGSTREQETELCNADGNERASCASD